MSINKFFDSFVQKHAAGELNETDDLNVEFNSYLTEKMAGLLVEDHEKSMTAEQMASHIKKLFKMCDDEKTEEKFLSRLGKAADMEDCQEKDIKACAKKLCDMDDEKCDDVIHELEGMVDYKDESSDDDDDDSDDEKDSDDSEDEDKDEDKKKVDEGIGVGSIVKTSNGREMVVLGKLDGGDVAAARLHHGKPLYRSQVNLRSDEYIPTGETLPGVMSKKKWDQEQNSIMRDREGHAEPGHRAMGAFDF